MVKVEKDHFFRAALEIGYSGDNDTLPYDLEAGFVKDKAVDLAALCLALFQSVETGVVGKPANFMNGLSIVAERLLAPSGPHGFRITTKIHPFWESLSEWSGPSDRRGKRRAAERSRALLPARHTGTRLL